MPRVPVPSIVVMALCFAQVIAAPAPAAPFVNLDFEQAQVQPINPNFIVAATGMPGWTPRIGGVQIANLDYNSIGIGLAAVSLFDREDSQLGLPIPQGRFFAALGGGPDGAASLSQAGDVPDGARTLRLLAATTYGMPLTTTLGGDPITFYPTGPLTISTLRWREFAADVSQWAGLSDVELRLTSFPGQGGTAFDRLEFSSIPIPEPASGWCVALTGVLRRRRH